MSYAVVNLSEVDEVLKDFQIDEISKKWLSKALKKNFSNELGWLVKLEELDISNIDEHIKKAIEKDEDVYEINNDEKVKSEIQYIVDWLTELEQRDPRLFSKIDRITWKQAVEHSTRWHEALARRSEKSKMKTIAFNDDCPVMFTHDDGMKWVWLKTDKARDDEGRIMGHCVGNGGYDKLNDNEGVFSLRDDNGCSLVTVHLSLNGIIQAKGKNNSNISNELRNRLNIFFNMMSVKMKKNETKKINKGLFYHLKWNGEQRFTTGSNYSSIKSRTDGPAVVKADGTKEWWLKGNLHRDDGPAIEHGNGDREWLVNGRHHREDGPAIITESGHEFWYKNGKLHRLDGPAVIKANGDEEWWVSGKCHREDGPAITRANGTKHWYLNGERHREDGPAVQYVNGDEEWYLNGDLHRIGGPAKVMNGKVEMWCIRGELHRLDGPAIIEIKDGVELKKWCVFGELHREDGPAIEKGKYKEWYRHGLLHRADGPAIEYANGDEEWRLNGQLHRADGPAIERNDGSQEWYWHGLAHRVSGPAIIYKNNDKKWYVYGKLHRADGPAVMRDDGEKQWFIRGKEYNRTEYYKWLRKWKDSGIEIEMNESESPMVDDRRLTF